MLSMYWRTGRTETPVCCCTPARALQEGKQTQQLIRHLPHSLISEQRHYLPLPNNSLLWSQHQDELSSATNPCMAQTQACITYRAQVIQGQRHSALCEHGCAAFRDSFTPKSRFLCRRNAVIPSQKPWPEFDATYAWAQHWGCGGTYYHGALSTTSVKTKVSGWASVSHQRAEPVAAEGVGWGVQDHSNHQRIHAALSSSSQWGLS